MGDLLFILCDVIEAADLPSLCVMWRIESALLGGGDGGGGGGFSMSMGANACGAMGEEASRGLHCAKLSCKVVVSKSNNS